MPLITNFPKPNQLYFADFNEKEFAGKVLAKIESSGEAEYLNQVRSKLATAYKYYFGHDLNGIHTASGLSRTGEQGELATFRVNHARALVNTLLNLVVSQRVAWQPKATNVDYESLKQVEVAKAVLEYYWLDRRVEKYVYNAVEEAIAFSEGYVLGLWDETAGEDVPDQLSPDATPEDPKPAKSGDFVFENVSTWDVIRDPRKRSWDSLDWVIVRLWRNKFELAAKFPAYADKIFSAPLSPEGQLNRVTKQSDNEDVPVYVFFHKPTAALPHGRESWILGNSAVLRDGSLSYTDLPLFRIAPAELIGTPYGYTQFFEIMAVQELIDSLHSSAATNLTTFGTQNIWLPPGAEISPDQLAGGVRIIQGTPNGDKKPEALQLCATPAELYHHLQELKHDQEMLFGVNAIVRGQVQSDKLSGTAMALLETQAKQQASGLHGSYRMAVQGLGDFVINESRKRAQAQRTISIVGRENAFLVQETTYSGESFGHIKRVLADIGNPLSQSVFGRSEQIKELMQLGLINNMEQYYQVMDTGRAEPVTQGLTNELLLIKAENDAISRGETPEVMLHDNHLLHGREHRSPVASPQARSNPVVLKADTEHMHKHYEAYFGVPAMQPVIDPLTGQPQIGPDGQPITQPDPMYRTRMLVLMGLQPPDPALMGPQPAPGGPPPGGPPPQPNGAPGQGASPLTPPPPQQSAEQNSPNAPVPGPGLAPEKARLPSFPKMPTTGAKWQPGAAPGQQS